MYNPLTPWIVQIHIEEHLRRAESFRRTHITDNPHSPWGMRLGLAVSDLLIASGEKLRQRYDPGSPCEDCSHASA